jgi:hypothetical protein
MCLCGGTTTREQAFVGRCSTTGLGASRVLRQQTVVEDARVTANEYIRGVEVEKEVGAHVHPLTDWQQHHHSN